MPAVQVARCGDSVDVLDHTPLSVSFLSEAHQNITRAVTAWLLGQNHIVNQTSQVRSLTAFVTGILFNHMHLTLPVNDCTLTVPGLCAGSATQGACD
jgi:hypothetical protein